jgi:hypothetical protein
VEQAITAVDQGADALIVQGEEAGGFGGGVGLMALLPQVVDAVSPVPVAAAGGIADGRGLAAALVLGAAGVNIGTRFLAAEETEVPDDWKRRIIESPSEETVRVSFAEQVFPPVGPGGYSGKTPRVLRTEWPRPRSRTDFSRPGRSRQGREGARAGSLHRSVHGSDQ